MNLNRQVTEEEWNELVNNAKLPEKDIDDDDVICSECGGNGDTGAPLELQCTACDGTGKCIHLDIDEIFDDDKELDGNGMGDK